MSKVQFPHWVYGPDKQSKIVYAQEELDALGGGWYDSPALHDDHEESAPAAVSDDGGSVNEGARPVMELLTPDNNTERHRLELEAAQIDLKVDKRWTDETLRRKILEKASQ